MTNHNLASTGSGEASGDSGSKQPAAGQERMSDQAILDDAVALAEKLLLAAEKAMLPPEKKQNEQLGKMLEDPDGKTLTFKMVDEVFRSSDPVVQASTLRNLIDEYGVPKYVPKLDQFMIRAGAAMSRFAPSLVMPQIEKRIRQNSEQVVLDGDPAAVKEYLDRRTAQGFTVNLNHLGEAVLGEQEARKRMDTVLDYLKQPHVTYISVKISAIFSQITLTAWDETLESIKTRLRELYRAAMPQNKFVNLDMEDFRDLELTLTAFRQVLDEPEFKNYSAGIVLQAYLPDSWNVQQQLTQWAKERVANDGAKIKVRIVKGANLAMESVEAETHGWYQAPYTTKAESDANFRRMLEFGCRPENAEVVRLGVASHNLFDVALALTLRERMGTTGNVEIEMLEGMANHQARAVKDVAKGLLVYAPAVQEEDFLSAMAYLVRRLDENTSPENFLHDLFGLQVGSAKWNEQKQRFVNGWLGRHTVSETSRRVKPAVTFEQPFEAHAFENEPDSDWTQAAARKGLQAAIDNWKQLPLGELESVDEVLERAKQAQLEWEQRGAASRAHLLYQAGEVMSRQRFQTIACMKCTAKKATPEADAEVSEAIDFARYYAKHFDLPEGVEAKALGTVVITPPWNFPYAIPCGGVLAALMAGNSVILKPAPETVAVSRLIAEQLWEAGIPRDVLQFYPCEDGEVGKSLLTDPRVGAVVLTGAFETARLFQSWRPSLRLFAETSGKNALIISKKADRELAAKDLVRSAFFHAGQKCSAASLAIVDAEVYDDPAFIRQVKDATESLHVGPATDPRSVVTPVIREPGNALERGLTRLDEGETWLVEPKQIGDDPCLWSPGIRMGVKPGSWFHGTECFGPVMGIMRSTSLEQAIEWQNATDFGLTAGIHTLDQDEYEYWKEKVQAGNLYVNRPITGAIVQRQPFGGWKHSAIGPGAKAGGPNYVKQFVRVDDTESIETSKLPSVERSYQQAWDEHYSREHDPTKLRCESNVFRYRPCRGVLMRASEGDALAIERAQLASKITGTPLTVSFAEQESEADFIARIKRDGKQFEFLRTNFVPSDAVLQAAYDSNLNWIDAPVTRNGQIELRFWLREQSVCTTLHRYGQIIGENSIQKN